MKRLKECTSHVKKRWQYISSVFIMTAITTAANINYVYAADNQYASNASDWILDAVQSFAVAVSAFVIARCLINRKFVQMIGAILLCAVILAIVFNPTMMRGIGENLLNIIIG